MVVEDRNPDGCWRKVDVGIWVLLTKTLKYPAVKGNYPSAPIQQSAYCGSGEYALLDSDKIGRLMLIICDPIALCLIFICLVPKFY